MKKGKLGALFSSLSLGLCLITSGVQAFGFNTYANMDQASDMPKIAGIFNRNSDKDVTLTVEEIRDVTGIVFSGPLLDKNHPRTIKINDITIGGMNLKIQKLYELAEESDEDIFLIIDSNGGEQDATFRMLEAMHLRIPRNIKVHTLCMGNVISAAANLVLANQKGLDVSTSSSVFVTHSPFVTSQEACYTIEDMAYGLNKLAITKNRVIEMVSEASGLKKEKVAMFYNNGHFVFSPKNAAKAGLIDFVLEWPGKYTPARYGQNKKSDIKKPSGKIQSSLISAYKPAGYGR
jgi:ATP-dependent protease ClpP protease subunit